MTAQLPQTLDLSPLSGLAPELASTFVKVSSDIALVIGTDGVIRNVVEGPGSLYAGSQEWVGRPWVDTATSETRRKIEQLLQEVNTSGISRRREVNHPGGGGADIPVSWAAVQLGHGGPVVAVGRDLRAVAAIQQRFMDTQLELERGYWQRRQAETRWRLLFQVARDAVLVMDADTLQVVEANPASEQMLLPPGQQWHGQTLGAQLEERSKPALEELFNTARATGHAAEVRLRLAHRPLSLEVSATPLRAEGRRCLLVRARPLEPAAELIEHTPDAVVITDSAGRIQMANPAFVALCGVDHQTRLKGLPLGEVLGDVDHRWPLLVAQVRSRGIVGQISMQLLAAGTQALRADVSAALLAEGDQEHIGFTLRPSNLPASALRDESLSITLARVAARLGQAPLPELLDQAQSLVECQLIDAAMSRTGGQLHDAAVLLGVPAEDLVARLRRLGLPLPPLN